MGQKIRFGEPYTLPLPKEKLPFDQKLVLQSRVPTYQQQTFQVYVVKGVLEQVKRHVQENARVECGGILIGHPFQDFDDPDMTFVVITAAIAQDSSSHSVAHFTVSPKEIEATRDEMQERYPGWVCVGWYHSHPGHGVFLSGQDMQIVRSIYNAEWHLALVIDPKSNEAAFFRGPEGERLRDWSELPTIPQTVKTISWYNQACEAVENGDPRELERLKQRLLSIPELSHWHSLGKYQNLELETPLLPKPAHDVDRLVVEIDAPSSSMEQFILENKQLQNQDADQIKEKYIRAVGYYESDSIASALNLFKEIPEMSPGYKDVEIYIGIIKNRGGYNNKKRLMR